VKSINLNQFFIYKTLTYYISEANLSKITKLIDSKKEDEEIIAVVIVDKNFKSGKQGMSIEFLI